MFSTRPRFETEVQGNMEIYPSLCLLCDHGTTKFSHKNLRHNSTIDQFRCIKIQSKTIDISTRFCGIITEFVGFSAKSLVMRSIVLGSILIYRNYCRVLPDAEFERGIPVLIRMSISPSSSKTAFRPTFMKTKLRYTISVE